MPLTLSPTGIETRAPPPRHRRTPARSRVGALALLATVLTGGVVAVDATAGVPVDLPTEAGGSSASLASTTVGGLSAEELAEREQRVSRSTDRAPVADSGKADRLASGAGVSRSGSRDLGDADPKVIAQALMGEYGLASGEFGCLEVEQLWEKESSWSTTADNPTSSAYGIPQALPGERMSTAGGDWPASAEPSGWTWATSATAMVPPAAPGATPRATTGTEASPTPRHWH